MTEKRYSGYEDEDYFNVIKDNVEDKILDDAYGIAELLNALYEENQELKAENEGQFRSIMRLSEKINDCRRILDD